MTSKNRELMSRISRRNFLGNALLASAASALVQARGFLGNSGWFEAAEAATPELLRDTFNGLLAFVVPGSDDYSVAQGVSSVERGGVDAGVIDVLMATLDQSTPYVPVFSAQVAAVLNGLAGAVNPSPPGTFVSPFAKLSFPEKVAVIQLMDSTEPLKLLAGILPPFVAFFCYSEAGAFDPATRSLTGQPLGWRLSNYHGVSDGRDEFLGYYPRPPHRPR